MLIVIIVCLEAYILLLMDIYSNCFILVLVLLLFHAPLPPSSFLISCSLKSVMFMLMFDYSLFSKFLHSISNSLF